MLTVASKQEILTRVKFGPVTLYERIHHADPSTVFCFIVEL